MKEIVSLHLKKCFFEEIKKGKKTEEFRSASPFNLNLFFEKDPDGVFNINKKKPYKIVRFFNAYTSEHIDKEIKDFYYCIFENNIPEGFEKNTHCIVIEF